MAIKSAGTYMQLSNLCNRCSKRNFCGNGMTDYFCTGYEPTASDIKVPPFTDGQKQLIEMTEKLAEKRGGKICDVDDDITDIKELLNDAIKRIEEPTNYDWLHSLNAEEMAEFLVKIELSAMHPVKRGAVDMEKFIEDVVEWLKQPHTFE